MNRKQRQLPKSQNPKKDSPQFVHRRRIEKNFLVGFEQTGLAKWYMVKSYFRLSLSSSSKSMGLI